MDENSLQQTQLLRDIWNEMKALRTELKGEIAQTNLRLDRMESSLGERIDQTNTSLAGVEFRLGHVEGTLVEMQGALRELADQQWTLTRVFKNVVDRQDEAIGDLRERVTRIESKLPDDE